MKHKIALLFTALFLAVGLTWALMPEGDGPTYYVSGSGSNSNEGLSASTAFKTIAYALEKAQTASGYVTINIAAGTYNETVTLNRGKVALVGKGATTIIGDAAVESGALTPALTINNQGVRISNLTVKGNKRAVGNTTVVLDVPTIRIVKEADTSDEITIENVTVNAGENTGAGIYVNRSSGDASIKNVTVNGHTTGIYVNASCDIDGATLVGDASSVYGVHVNRGPVTLNKIVASGYSAAALVYDYDRGVSKLTNSKLSDSGYGLRMKDGELSVSNTEIYGKGNDEPIFVEDRSTLILNEGTKLYRSFEDTNDNNFIAYDRSTKVVTDNGAKFFYGTNYSQSRVIKVYDRTNRQQQNLLRNAYPVESLRHVFRTHRDENENLSTGWTVVLPAGDPITLSRPIYIYTRITLEGNNVTLKGQPVYVDEYRDTEATAIIQNLTISNVDVAGVANLVANRNLTLLNVTLSDGEKAISVANGKTVTATNLTTSKNTQGGVQLIGNASLLIEEGDHIADLPAVFTTADSYNSNIVKTSGVSWQVLANDAAKTGYADITDFWVRVATIVKAPAATPVIYREQLWNSVLTGGEVKYDGEAVTGRFVWLDPSQRVEDGAVSYSSIFIPDNQKKFFLLPGAVSLQVKHFYKVTTAISERGKVVIKDAKPDDMYLPGDVLELEAVPFDGYEFGEFSVSPGRINRRNISSGTFTVGQSDAVISHDFQRISASTIVNYPLDPTDGEMYVYTEQGVYVPDGTGVVPGTRLYVLVKPASTKVLKSMTYYYGTPVLNGYITAGTEPVNIQTVFEAKSGTSFVIRYPVSGSLGGFVHFYDGDGNIYLPGMAIPNGTKVTPVISPVFGKQLDGYSLGGAYYQMVNGIQTTIGSVNMDFMPTFTDVVYPVSASIDNAEAGSVRVSGSEATNNTRVVATIHINNGYKLLAVIANGKELSSSQIRRSDNVEADVRTNSETTIRVITRKLEKLDVDMTQQVYTFYSNAVNFPNVITKAPIETISHPFIVKGIPAGLERINRFTVRYRDHSSVDGYSSTIPTAVGTYDVQIHRDADDFYQELTVDVKSGLKIVDNYYPLRDLTRTKTNPAKPTFASSATYDGSVFGNLATNPVSNKDWVVTYRQQDIPVLYPVNAGAYKIIGYRAADTLYHAQVDIDLGTFTINKAASNASVTYATDILQGQSLAASSLIGNANIDGTFSWAAPETKMSTAGTITSNKAIFTPYSSNYTTDANLATSINVLAMAAGNLRTITVNLTNPEKGTYALTRETIPVGAGTIITTGERIRVSFETTDPAYTAVLKINGVQYPNGTTYTVPATGDMVISLDFMKIGEAPAIIGITGINLSSLEKTSVAGDVFTLTPTITPANASDLRVFWTSDNEFVATVNADGKVTVHHTGLAIITATTASGHSVSCILNGHLTGNEDILTGVQVYTVDKQYICIEAGSPVKVVISDALGRIVYNASVNQRQLVNLPAGTYFVVVADQKTKATVKVVL